MTWSGTDTGRLPSRQLHRRRRRRLRCPPGRRMELLVNRLPAREKGVVVWLKVNGTGLV